MKYISVQDYKNLLFKGSTIKIGKRLILNHCLFSLTFVSNKDIFVPQWFVKFILLKPLKINKEIVVIFNDSINQSFICQKPFFYYKGIDKESRLIKILERVEAIVNYFHKELNSFVLHASCLNINSSAYPFIADSNEGKTTLVKLMQDYFEVIHDEAVIVHFFGNRHFISSTIITHMPNLITNKCLPIQELFVLKKSNINRISAVTNKEINETILRNIKTKVNINDEKIQRFFSNYPIKLLEHYPFRKTELKEMLIKNDISLHNRKMQFKM